MLQKLTSISQESRPCHRANRDRAYPTKALCVCSILAQVAASRMASTQHKKHSAREKHKFTRFQRERRGFHC